MNVSEFTGDGITTLYTFWQIGAPLVLLMLVIFGFLTSWAMRGAGQPALAR